MYIICLKIMKFKKTPISTVKMQRNYKTLNGEVTCFVVPET